jgi:Na+-translocating ferredoxin:NAD+ oxidoreductase RnfG subunit
MKNTLLLTLFTLVSGGLLAAENDHGIEYYEANIDRQFE